MMGYTISKAGIEDAIDLDRLVNSAYRGESSRKGWTTEADLLDGSRVTPDLLNEIINNPEITILKYMEGKNLLGCIELKRDGERLYLGMLTVEPNHQGKGIGKILLHEAETWADTLGCSCIYMTVISRRKELIAWYKRHGYKDTGEVMPFNMPDARWGIPKFYLEFIVLEKRIMSQHVYQG